MLMAYTISISVNFVIECQKEVKNASETGIGALRSGHSSTRVLVPALHNTACTLCSKRLCYSEQSVQAVDSSLRQRVIRVIL